jgi:transposase
MTTGAVLRGAERRRRWSEAEKARIVEESLAPDATVSGVAQRHDVHRNLLHYWRRQAQQGVSHGEEVKLLPVALPAGVGQGPSATGSIEIELDGMVRVRVDSRVDEAALRLVLRVLGR